LSGGVGSPTKTLTYFPYPLLDSFFIFRTELFFFCSLVLSSSISPCFFCWAWWVFFFSDSVRPFFLSPLSIQENSFWRSFYKGHVFLFPLCFFSLPFPSAYRFCILLSPSLFLQLRLFFLPLPVDNVFPCSVQSIGGFFSLPAYIFFFLFFRQVGFPIKDYSSCFALGTIFFLTSLLESAYAPSFSPPLFIPFFFLIFRSPCHFCFDRLPLLIVLLPRRGGLFFPFH